MGKASRRKQEKTFYFRVSIEQVERALGQWPEIPDVERKLFAYMAVKSAWPALEDGMKVRCLQHVEFRDQLRRAGLVGELMALGFAE